MRLTEDRRARSSAWAVSGWRLCRHRHGTNGWTDGLQDTVISEVGPTPEYSFKLLSDRGKEGGGGNNGTGEK